MQGVLGSSVGICIQIRSGARPGHWPLVAEARSRGRLGGNGVTQLQKYPSPGNIALLRIT